METKSHLDKTALALAKKWKLDLDQKDIQEIASLISPTDPESKLKIGQNPAHWGNAAWCFLHCILYLLTQQAKHNSTYVAKDALQFTWLIQNLITCKKCRNSFQWFLDDRKVNIRTISTAEKWSRLLNDAHNFVNNKHNIASVDRINALDIKSIDDLPIPDGMPPKEFLDLPIDVKHARLTKRVVPYQIHAKLMQRCAKTSWIDAMFTWFYYLFEHYPDDYLYDKQIDELRKKYKRMITVFAAIFAPICPSFITVFQRVFISSKRIWDHSLLLLITLNGFERMWKEIYAADVGIACHTGEKWKPLHERMLDVRESMKESLAKMSLTTKQHHF